MSIAAGAVFGEGGVEQRLLMHIFPACACNKQITRQNAGIYRSKLMNTPKQNPLPVTDPRSLLKALQDDFPVFRDCKPLAIGIDKQLLARLPELDRKTLRIVLGMHTHSKRYLKAVEKGATRFGLDGNPGVELTEAHRKHATDSLQERSKKDAERRKAQQDLEAAERKRDAEERQHAEKLGQLAAKFGRGN